MRLVIVTGMSGAGKTAALKMLEDMGFYCVDNLPIPLVGKFAELVESSSGAIKSGALGIDVRSGVELGLMNTVAGKARDIADKYKNELDFIIGSSHLVRGLDPYYPAYYEGRTEIEGIRDYFESILENVTLIDDFDVYGHLDYVVRYCPSGEKIFRMADYNDVLEQIFKIIIPKGKGIEINTGSLYKNMSYAHPHMDILKLYKDMGGEIITVGSDAHKPEYLCYDFETYARDALTSLGYRYYCTFKNRKPEFNPL